MRLRRKQQVAPQQTQDSHVWVFYRNKSCENKWHFYTCISFYYTKVALQYNFKAYTDFFNVYMTHLLSFVSFCCLMRVYWQSQFKFPLVPSKNHFHFLHIPAGPYSENTHIYTSTLILCNSLNYTLIDTKLCTILHLLLFYHSSELHGQTYWYQCCTALC